MSVTVCLPLFGHPGHELEEGSIARGKDLRTLADTLADRLRQAADHLERLTAGGWTARVAMFDLILSHPRVTTREEAETHLRAVGVDPEQLMIVEDIEEEDAAD